MKLFYQRDSLPVQSFEQDIDQNTTFKNLYEEIHKTLGIKRYLSVASEGYHPETSVSASNLIFGDTLNVKICLLNLDMIECMDELHEAVLCPCPDKNKLVIKYDISKDTVHDLLKTYPILVNAGNFMLLMGRSCIDQDIINNIDFDIPYSESLSKIIIKTYVNHPEVNLTFNGVDILDALNQISWSMSSEQSLMYILSRGICDLDCLTFCVEENLEDYVDVIMKKCTITDAWWETNIHNSTCAMERAIELGTNIPQSCAEILMRRNNFTYMNLLQMKGLDFTTDECHNIACCKYKSVNTWFFFQT